MKFVSRCIVQVLFFFINYLPLILGLGYVTTLLIAGVAVVYSSPSWAWTTLQYGWKGYLMFVGITMAIMTTFSYQHCCVGMQGFRGHLRHFGTKRHLENLLTAVFWPYEWFVIDRNLRGWEMMYLDVVLNAVHLWFVEIWRGVTLETWRLRNGEVEKVETTYVRSDGK